MNVFFLKEPLLTKPMPWAALIKALGTPNHLSDEICQESTEVDDLKSTFVQAILTKELHPSHDLNIGVSLF